MVDITLFELHLDDLDLSRDRPAADSREGRSADSSGEEATADGGGGSPIAAAVALAFVAAVAVLAHRLLTTDHETATDEADADDAD